MSDATRTAVRLALPRFRKQFECGRKPILDRELADAMIFFDGLALVGHEGRAALDALRDMERREAEDLILQVMKENPHVLRP